ncbi:MAG TPA: V-type ATP synthase subunit F [Methanospirillum sp.]|nr:V-type ATP synthase subunit F [Methanospirillum sp.]
MYKIIIITDPESGDGFRLAGATVVEASTPEEAEKVLIPFLDSDDVGIIAVREDFMACLDKTLLCRIERCYHPVIIPIPAPHIGGSMGSYIEQLLKRAIGFNIVMRG